MHENFFADCARPTRVVCLRFPLLTYSIGHELFLIKDRNPLLFADHTLFDLLPFNEQKTWLLHAAITCSDTYSYRQRLESPSVFQRIRILRHKWNVKILMTGLRDSDYPVAVAEVRNYLAEAHVSFPAPDPVADDVCASTKGYTPLREQRGRSFGSPQIAQLLNFVTTLQPSAFSLQPCLYDFPYALAASLYATHLEIAGSCHIENADEYEQKLENEQQKAEAIAEEQAEEKRKAESGKAGNPEQPIEHHTEDEYYKRKPDLTPDPSSVAALRRVDTSNPAPAHGLATPPPDLGGPS